MVVKQTTTVKSTIQTIINKVIKQIVNFTTLIIKQITTIIVLFVVIQRNQTISYY